MIEKDVLVDVMDAFAVWMWNKQFKFTEAEADAFLAEYGITRQWLVDEGLKHGVVLKAAVFEDLPEKLTIGQKVGNWIFG